MRTCTCHNGTLFSCIIYPYTAMQRLYAFAYTETTPRPGAYSLTRVGHVCPSRVNQHGSYMGHIYYSYHRSIHRCKWLSTTGNVPVTSFELTLYKISLYRKLVEVRRPNAANLVTPAVWLLLLDGLQIGLHLIKLFGLLRLTCVYAACKHRTQHDILALEPTSDQAIYSVLVCLPALQYGPPCDGRQTADTGNEKKHQSMLRAQRESNAERADFQQAAALVGKAMASNGAQG